MTTSRQSLYEHARRARGSNTALAFVVVLAGVASAPSALLLRGGFPTGDTGTLATPWWAVAAALLAGYLLMQFLAAVPTADDYVADNPEEYGWTFAFLRATAVRPFSTLVAAVWLAGLSVVAPLVGVPTAPAAVAGVVACAAFFVVVAQPHAGPTLEE